MKSKYPSNPLEYLKETPSGNLADQLVAKIRYLIVSGDIEPGFAFPNENDFCSFLNVGRGTLREAYKVLADQGFISRTKRGTTVNEWNTIAEKLPFSVALELSESKDLLEVRSMVEVQIAELAALRRTQSNLDKMAEALEKMEKNGNDPKKLSYYDTVFHLELAHASQNQLLDNMMHNIMGSYTSSFFKLFDEYGELRNHAIGFHKRIFEAVATQDAKVAKRVMKEHINDVLQYSQPVSTVQERLAHAMGQAAPSIFA